MKNRSFLEIVLTTLFMFLLPCFVRGFDRESVDSFDHFPPRSPAGPALNAKQEPSFVAPVEQALAILNCVHSEEVTIETYFNWTFKDTLEQRGFTCVGDEPFSTASQGANLLPICDVSFFCPWTTPVCLDVEAECALCDEPRTRVVGTYLQDSNEKKAVQFFCIFEKIFNPNGQPAQDPFIFMIERPWRQGDHRGTTSDVEAFLESVHVLDGLITPPMRVDSQKLNDRVVGGENKRFVGQEVEFLIGLGRDRTGLTEEEETRHRSIMAQRGCPEAQFNYALSCEHGLGQKAEQYLKLAADQGHIWAQCQLGNLYSQIFYFPANPSKAALYYTLAANQGLAQAQCNLGRLHSEGRGVIKSYEKALYYYNLAAHQGNVTALYNIGALYKDGRGVESNNEEALRYYKRAADQGLREAQYHLGAFYVRVRNYEEGIRYYYRAVAQGSSSALYELGMLYVNGVGVPQNRERGLAYLRQASRSNRSPSHPY